MVRSHAPLVLVVVVGPQASGKSALAAATTRALRAAGESVALVELDQIADMARPTLPDWGVAHAIFESVTGQWARADLTCVIAEGSGSRDEADRLCAQLPEAAVAVVVAVTASFDTALDRARRHPTRGVSKEHGFLSRVYEAWPAELARIEADVVVDTELLTIEEGVDVVRTAVAAARESAHT